MLDHNVVWIKNGMQKEAVVRVLRKPMTTFEISVAARNSTPKITIRDAWAIMSKFLGRKLALCITPLRTKGRIYYFTNYGREVVWLSFNIYPQPLPAKLNWEAYAAVVAGKDRKLVLQELGTPNAGNANANDNEDGKSYLMIWRHLKQKHPIGIDNVIRVIRDLEALKLVKAVGLSRRGRHKLYDLTPLGEQILNQLQK